MRVARVGGALIASVAVIAAATPVFAWSQLNNSFPSTPTNCTNSGSYQCVKWPRLANGQSITVWVFRDLSLQDDTHVNLYQDALDGFTRWNAAPANEPFLRNSTSLTGSTGADQGYPTVIYRDDLGCTGEYGRTYTFELSSDVHKIISFQTIMNAAVRFDHTLDFHSTTTPDPTCPIISWADSRKVMTHEEGHGLALGHTGAVAIMKQGETTYFTVQADDNTGLQAIYGAP